MTTLPPGQIPTYARDKRSNLKVQIFQSEVGVYASISGLLEGGGRRNTEPCNTASDALRAAARLLEENDNLPTTYKCTCDRFDVQGIAISAGCPVGLRIGAHYQHNTVPVDWKAYRAPTGH